MWKIIQSLMDEFGVEVAVTLQTGEVSSFSSWLNFPSESYGDVESFGPFKLSDAKSIEIFPMERQKLGKLIGSRLVDHSAEIKERLEAHGISYLVNENNILISFR